MTDAASLGAAAQSLLAQGAQAAEAGGSVGVVPAEQAGADARFAAAMDNARTQAAQPLATAEAVSPVNPTMQGVFDKLSSLDTQAKGLAEEARAAELSGGTMTPGEVVQLSVRAHEFMFNAQLTSNMANRTSDGLSQLFRQQS